MFEETNTKNHLNRDISNDSLTQDSGMQSINPYPNQNESSDKNNLYLLEIPLDNNIMTFDLLKINDCRFIIKNLISYTSLSQVLDEFIQDFKYKTDEDYIQYIDSLYSPFIKEQLSDIIVGSSMDDSD